MLLAFVDHITPRHQYIFDFMFRDVLGIPVELTENPDHFEAWEGAKLSYCQPLGLSPQPSGSSFRPAGLLSDCSLYTQSVKALDYQGMQLWFPVEDHPGLPFDPFSMAFYILTRMEEYLPFEADEHGRFTEKNSLQEKYGLLQEPVVNRLAFIILEKLQQSYPDLKPDVRYSFLPTVDVDIAFAHLGKDPVRAMGGLTRLALRGDFNALKQRLETVRGKSRDPYDNFDLHLQLAKKFHTGLIYFLLVGDYGRYDKMLSYKNRHFKELIRKLAAEAGIGIHPSYASFDHPELLMKELERLEIAANQEIVKHRAHFLRMRFPGTFRKLMESGITDDYSLGYSGTNGFRAGTATPFCFYDVLKEEKTTLKVHPFIFMDSAMIDHRKLTPDEAFAESAGLVDKVRKWGGEAIGIWHNYSLCEQGQYRGWQQVFKDIMEHASK